MAVMLTVREPFQYRLARDFIISLPAYTKAIDKDAGIIWLPYRDSHTRQIHEIGLLPGDLPRIFGNEDVARRIFLSHYALDQADRLLQAKSSVCRNLYAQYRGLRPVQFADPFEGMAWTIIGQQITLQFASTLKQRIAERYGTIWRGTHVFPSAAEIARLDVEDLRTLQLSRNKARYLIDLAQSIEEGWSLDQFYTLPTPQALQQLEQRRGVGPWTARYLLLRVFGHVDVIPIHDVALQRHWGQLSGLNRHATPQELQEASRAWDPYAGLFAFYLWVNRRQSKQLMPSVL